MKYFKIENNKVYFLKATDTGDVFTEIDKIGKDDLLKLLNKAIEPGFEMDAFDEKLIEHKAHQTIYKKLHDKFAELVQAKEQFKDESESLYKNALEKYVKKEPNADTPGN